MMGHYTTRACNTPLPAGGIKAFQSESVWYGQPQHDRSLEPGSVAHIVPQHRTTHKEYNREPDTFE